jgi:hypothetical protein
LPDLLNRSDDDGFLGECDRRCRPLWNTGTLIVLHGPSTQSAAIDLESKFTEAALGNVQIADYRNFAHGRHHWLAKRGDDSAVLALLTPDDEEIASATLKLLPKSLPKLQVTIPFRGILANLSALVHGLHIVASAGRARGIDPGKPGVPSFGRKIYHLKAAEYAKSRTTDLPINDGAAIERKSRKAICSLAKENQLPYWQDAHAAFVQRLTQTHFHAVVFDYDGTLCGERDRQGGPSAVVSRHLIRLLKAGIPIGIATGRGKSVKKALRQCIPERYWERVLVGYYNGGDLGWLNNELRPDGAETTCEALVPIAKAIAEHPALPQLATFEIRIPQIKVEAKTEAASNSVWAHLVQLVYQFAIPGVSVQRSSHSMDVVAPGVTKQNVVEGVIKLISKTASAPILCIGDRGQWPGNDFVLLSGPCSLSVDEVSQNPSTCWNLAPPGIRSVQACLYYLESIEATGGQFQFAASRRRRSTP